MESNKKYIHCPIMPYMPFTGETDQNEPYYIYNNRSSSLVYFPQYTSRRPGNCVVSIAVLENTLRTHFENDIYLFGERRYIHIHLLFEKRGDKIEYLDQVYPGMEHHQYYRLK